MGVCIDAVVARQTEGPNHLRKIPKTHSVSQFQNKASNILISYHKDMSNIACHNASYLQKRIWAFLTLSAHSIENIS